MSLLKWYTGLLWSKISRWYSSQIQNFLNPLDSFIPAEIPWATIPLCPVCTIYRFSRGLLWYYLFQDPVTEQAEPYTSPSTFNTSVNMVRSVYLAPDIYWQISGPAVAIGCILSKLLVVGSREEWFTADCKHPNPHLQFCVANEKHAVEWRKIYIWRG